MGIQTAAIPINIEEARELSGADIVSSAAETPASNSALEATEGGIFANHSNLESLQATKFSMRRWAGIWTTMIVSYIAISVGVRRKQRLHADPAHVRRKIARRRAAAR